MFRLPVVFVFLGIVLIGCANQVESTPSTVAPNAVIATSSRLLDTSGDLTIPDVGQVAPDFQFSLANGMTTKLSDLKGKRVIVNFWATWCEPCREEMPDLEKIRREYGENVVILAVNKVEKVERINGFSGEVPVGFALIANPQGDITERYGTRTVPNSFFINTDGTIGARSLQTLSYVSIKQKLDTLR